MFAFLLLDIPFEMQIEICSSSRRFINRLIIMKHHEFCAKYTERHRQGQMVASNRWMMSTFSWWLTSHFGNKFNNILHLYWFRQKSFDQKHCVRLFALLLLFVSSVGASSLGKPMPMHFRKIKTNRETSNEFLESQFHLQFHKFLSK